MKRSRRGKRTRRRYRGGGPPSRLRQSLSANPDGTPPDPSSRERVVFAPKREAKPGFQFPVSGHNTFVVERANKMYPGQKTETHKERKEREAKAEKKGEEGFVPIPHKPGSRFKVSEKFSSP